LDIEAFPVLRSKDGIDWEFCGKVVDSEEGIISNWQPMIFELPCNLGKLKEGTLLLAGCSRTPKGSITHMRIWYSLDFGESWSFLSNVADGLGFNPGHLSKGLWEPYLICSDDGVLYCFYSDELYAEEHSQMIVYRKSVDGINWSDTFRVVACKHPRLRPGMASVCRMSDGRYFITYEMIGMDGAPVYFKYGNTLDDWGDPESDGNVIVTDDFVGPGATPFNCFCPGAGDKGALIVSGRFQWGRPSSTGVDIYISYDLGKTWGHIDSPVPYKQDSKHRYSYSPCLYTRSDGKVIFLNDVNSDFDKEKADLKYSVLDFK
ncbi:MAG: exo-alpha-sialidase, partial [Clostridia bacterium]|nr:exo-alpha-sialidase [Clostridia bacterium]